MSYHYTTSGRINSPPTATPTNLAQPPSRSRRRRRRDSRRIHRESEAAVHGPPGQDGSPPARKRSAGSLRGVEEAWEESAAAPGREPVAVRLTTFSPLELGSFSRALGRAAGPRAASVWTIYRIGRRKKKIPTVLHSVGIQDLPEDQNPPSPSRHQSRKP
jgi:hypothetical protein